MGQVGVHRYLVCLKDGSDMRIAASRVDGPLPQPELLSILTKVKVPVTVEDMIVTGATDPRPVLGSLGLHAIVPMALQGQIRGVIVLGEKLNRDPFTSADFEFLSALGSLAIISLENARLFKEAIEKQRMEDELLIARDIQKGLLPSVLPVVPGIDIAAANFSSKQVGGDYYDVVPLDDHRYILAIGDVSGKGTPAALLMANIQATIRALVPLQLTAERADRAGEQSDVPEHGREQICDLLLGRIGLPESHVTVRECRPQSSISPSWRWFHRAIGQRGDDSRRYGNADSVRRGGGGTERRRSAGTVYRWGQRGDELGQSGVRGRAFGGNGSKIR